MSYEELMKGLPNVRPSIMVSIDINRLRKIPSEYAPVAFTYKKRFEGTNSKEVIRLPPVLSLEEIKKLETKRKRVQHAPNQRLTNDNNVAKTKAPNFLQAPAKGPAVALRAKIDSLHASLFGGKLPPPAPARVPKQLTDKPYPLAGCHIRPPLPALPKPESGLMRQLPSRALPSDSTAKRKREEDVPATLPVEKRFKDYKDPVRLKAPIQRSGVQITAEINNLHRSLFEGSVPSKSLTNRPRPMSERPVRPPLPVAEAEDDDLPPWCRQSFYDYNYQFSFD
ncbi:hypothetical protein GHT06_020076 [Daphnia sinensis]|uniref:Uncharacterized protein n=1 Tax=Daphnia sinensis TaxID=1820382 RepID=A0AAD5KLN9_9CRUS|nr:hypothetical protein GHT06_020076 [Daphnia sinensis]